ncbi:DNA binding protein [Bacillus phage Mgbh1]|uniref:Transcriptional regulator-like protein n=1 Tax=Bacillus phage Mgbh1 TaxID=1796993 RepID=A0A142F1P0_9CAUD|nr:DNA binding protein [Bacillus phage Mgbh1]AMQ66697.1 transcriptional regulator-like protein [Bacillus phage Mgbh1]
MNEKETKIFVKMYVDAVSSGLIADMGPDNWQTLCVIASYMDENGRCYPTQAQIARGLGIRRETANRRVKRLLDYRWCGRPIIEAYRKRNGKGVWENTEYVISAISQLRIFDAEPEDVRPCDT